MADEQQPQAGFDMALATLQRINLELYHCNESLRQGAIPNWWNALLNVYKETHVYLKKEADRKIHLDLKQACAKAFKEWEDYQLTYTAQRSKGLPQMYKPPQDVFHKLMEWELALRKSLDDAGLLMKKAETGYGQMV